MISKLVAWAEDRPSAVARMRRALAEYLVAGIKTTVPFFVWLFEQPDFLEGRFHTTYLDEILKLRNGRPFVEATSEAEEIAAVAAAVQAAMSPGTLAVTAGRCVARGQPVEGAGTRRGFALKCATTSTSMAIGMR